MTALYNEIDDFAADWLENLIHAGHIAPGVVDRRSIVDLDPDELRRFTQCHFFAGLGGWSAALRLAGWPDDRPVWTGSCPCQPFSAAGKGKGVADERHLWPAWFRLIRECRPESIFGEQVGGPAGIDWLAAVHLDLQDDAYAVGAADLPAASVGAFHIRQRLFFVADPEGRRLGQGSADASRGDEGARARGAGLGLADDGGGSLMGDAIDARLEGHGRGEGAGAWAGDSLRAAPGSTAEAGTPGVLGDASGQRRAEQWGRSDEREPACDARPAAAGFWSDAEWIPCRDGKARPVESGSFPLAHGVSGRVGRLRAYGNAIVPQVAAAFISAALDS